MSQQTLEINSVDDHRIFLRQWLTASNIQAKGVIHIAHGMAEHSGRYNETATSFARAGYNVVAHDHRGHGHSANKDALGLYARKNGWHLLKHDMHNVQSYIANEFSTLPVYILGHSMGSFITMAYLMDNPLPLAGTILSGSNFDDVIKFKVLKTIVKGEKLRLSPLGKSAIIEHLSFGSFNRPYEPSVTGFDWLSRDPDTVKAYVEDELSGFFCTCQLWDDLLTGLIHISSEKNIKKIPTDLPIYLFAGTDDPVGNYGKGVQRLAQKMLLTGHSNVSCRLYKGGRHEMLNEINKKEVLGHIIHWLKTQN
jgi:alpha-beta hydrolase superfamily lysophospholipase